MLLWITTKPLNGYRLVSDANGLYKLLNAKTQEADGKEREVYKLTFDAIMETLDKMEIDFKLMDLMMSANPEMIREHPRILTQMLYSNARTAARMVTNLYMEDNVEFEPFDFDKTDINGWLFGLVQHLGQRCNLFEWTDSDSPKTKFNKIHSKYNYGLADGDSVLPAFHALKPYLSEHDKMTKFAIGKQKMTVENWSAVSKKEHIDWDFLLDVPLLTFAEAEQMFYDYDKERRTTGKITTGNFSQIRKALVMYSNLRKRHRHDVSKLFWALLVNAKRVATAARDKYDNFDLVLIPAIDIDRISTEIEESVNNWNAVCKLLKPLICWLFDFVKYVSVKYPCDLSPDSVINYGMSDDKPDKHSAVQAAPGKFPGLPLKHSGESWFNLAMHETHYVNTLHLAFEKKSKDLVKAAADGQGGGKAKKDFEKRKAAADGQGGGKAKKVKTTLADLIEKGGGLNQYIAHSKDKTGIQMKLLMDFNEETGLSEDYEWLQRKLQEISREQNTTNASFFDRGIINY